MVDTPNNVSPVAPRGTDRVRRRAAQAAHAEQAQVEAATLVPPRGQAKLDAIAANKAQVVARFGEQSPAKVKQAENKAQAQKEDRLYAGAPVLQASRLEPGQQVDNLTARRMAKAADRADRDEITAAAKAAGSAVFQTLKGRQSHINRRSVHRKVAQQAVKIAAQTASAG